MTTMMTMTVMLHSTSKCGLKIRLFGLILRKKVLITNEMPKVLKGATKINHGTREENVIGRHRHRERF